MSVGFCPCAALDDACRLRQNAVTDDTEHDEDGSGDEHFLYYDDDHYDYDYDYYHNNDDFEP